MTGSDWRSMFEPQRPQRPPMEPEQELGPVEDELSINPTAYRPWILQRVKSRPAALLHLRRYEPRSGLWSGWAMSYPHLIEA